MTIPKTAMGGGPMDSRKRTRGLHRVMIASAALWLTVSCSDGGQSVESRLAALEARESIRALIYGYGRALDHRDFNAFAALFEPAEGTWVGARRAADTSIVERGADFSLPSYFLLDLSLATREIYLLPGHESRFALRSRNLLVTRGPDPGFSGFEYPLSPAEIFLELEHTY